MTIYIKILPFINYRRDIAQSAAVTVAAIVAAVTAAAAVPAATL